MLYICLIDAIGRHLWFRSEVLRVQVPDQTPINAWIAQMVEQWTEDPRVISSILISSTILQRGFLSAVRQTTVNCFFSLRSKLIHKIICPISRIGRCSSLKTRVISEFESLIGYHYLCRISLMVKRDSATVKLRVRFSYLAPIVRMSGIGEPAVSERMES